MYGSELASQHRREQRDRHAAADQDREERAPERRRGEAPAQNQDERDGCRDGEARVPLDAHQPHVDGHVVADEQEVVRARAAADLLDAHEHEHHDLDHDRVEVGRADDEALPVRVEPSVREGQDEMREHRGRDQADDQPDRERQRAIRLDERPGEEREARRRS